MKTANYIQKLESKKVRTMHLLHFVLTLLTGGLWLFVWILVGATNWYNNKLLQEQIDMINFLDSANHY